MPRTAWLQLGVVCVAEFVVWTGFGAIMPYLPIFLREQAHSSMFMIGVIAAAFYLGTLLFSSPFGWLSDTVGRKPVMIGGMVLYAVAMFLFTRTADPYWFVLFRFMEGVGTAAVAPAAMAFVADISTEQTRSKAYGILISAQFGGLIVGPALAPPIYSLAGGGGAGFYAIFYFGAALAAVTTVLVVVLIREPATTARRKETRRGRKAERPPYREILSPAILAFLVIGFTSHFAMGAFEVVWSIWLKELGASLTFIAMTWVAFSVPMLLSFVGGIVADRYSRFALMYAGYTASAVAWIIYGTTTNLWVFIVVNVLEGLAIAFSYPAKQAFLVQVSPPRVARHRDRAGDHVHAAGRHDRHLPGAGDVRLDLRVRAGRRRGAEPGRAGDRGAHPAARVAPRLGATARAEEAGARGPDGALPVVAAEPPSSMQ